MELHEFISQTLVQISKGIEDANTNLSESQGIVNPRNIIINHSSNADIYAHLSMDNDERRRVVEKIDFDVAVTVTKGTETKGGIGIAVGTIGIGSQGKSDAENVLQNRIKFTIPMAFPNGDEN